VIYLSVALGGALGALARFGVGNWVIGLGSGHLHMATFSAFSLELLADFQEGQVVRAVLYASLTVFLCLISCLAGVELARSTFD
jgi:fluoride ion exporter CrcB/FEX